MQCQVADFLRLEVRTAEGLRQQAGRASVMRSLEGKI